MYSCSFLLDKEKQCKSIYFLDNLQVCFVFIWLKKATKPATLIQFSVVAIRLSAFEVQIFNRTELAVQSANFSRQLCHISTQFHIMSKLTILYTLLIIYFSSFFESFKINWARSHELLDISE